MLNVRSSMSVVRNLCRATCSQRMYSSYDQRSPNYSSQSDEFDDNRDGERELRTIPTYNPREQREESRQRTIRRHRGPSFNRIELMGTLVSNPFKEVSVQGKETVVLKLQTNKSVRSEGRFVDKWYDLHKIVIPSVFFGKFAMKQLRIGNRVLIQGELRSHSGSHIVIHGEYVFKLERYNGDEVRTRFRGDSNEGIEEEQKYNSGEDIEDDEGYKWEATDYFKEDADDIKSHKSIEYERSDSEISAADSNKY